MSDLKTGFGSRCCITVLVKTFCPKISPGASAAVKKLSGVFEALTASIAWGRAVLPLIDRSSAVAHRARLGVENGRKTALMDDICSGRLNAARVENVSAR